MKIFKFNTQRELSLVTCTECWYIVISLLYADMPILLLLSGSVTELEFDVSNTTVYPRTWIRSSKESYNLFYYNMLGNTSDLMSPVDLNFWLVVFLLLSVLSTISASSIAFQYSICIDLGPLANSPWWIWQFISVAFWNGMCCCWIDWCKEFSTWHVL